MIYDLTLSLRSYHNFLKNYLCNLLDNRRHNQMKKNQSIPGYHYNFIKMLINYDLHFMNFCLKININNSFVSWVLSSFALEIEAKPPFLYNLIFHEKLYLLFLHLQPYIIILIYCIHSIHIFYPKTFWII